MKDAYSFDLYDEGLAESYRQQREAYQRIFERLGLDYRIVSAVSGAMGGSASEEFLAPAAAGEDTYAQCPSCGFAANAEALSVAVASAPVEDRPAIEELDTPDTPTIETLAEHLGVPASATLKNLLVKVDGEIAAVGVPGHREVDLGKLAEHLAPAQVELVTAEDFVDRPDLVRGYVGPQGMAARPSGTSPTPASPPARRGSPAPTRRTSTRGTSCAAATSRWTTTSTWSSSSRATPARSAAPASSSAGPSRSATSSSSAASTPTPSSWTCSGRTASPRA